MTNNKNDTETVTDKQKQDGGRKKLNENYGEFSENTRQTPLGITDSIAPPPRKKGDKDD